MTQNTTTTPFIANPEALTEYLDDHARKARKEQERKRKRENWTRGRTMPKELTDEHKASVHELRSLPVSEIFSDSEFNCRDRILIDDELNSLATTIRAFGLMSPIEVRPYDDGDYKWKIISGHRRYAACRYLLKWDTISAFIVEGLTDEQASMRCFWENIERKNLDIMEEANQIAKMFPAGTPCRVIANVINRDTRWVLRRRNLLEAHPDIQNAAKNGRLSERRIDELLKCATEAMQLRLLDEYLKVSEGFTFGTAGPIKRAKGKQSRNGRDRMNRPTVEELTEAIVKLLSASIIGLGPRCLAYAAGFISREDLENDILELQSMGQLVNHGETPTQPESYPFHPANRDKDPD